jgi:hypothetical protein
MFSCEIQKGKKQRKRERVYFKTLHLFVVLHPGNAYQVHLQLSRKGGKWNSHQVRREEPFSYLLLLLPLSRCCIRRHRYHPFADHHLFTPTIIVAFAAIDITRLPTIIAVTDNHTAASSFLPK